MTARLQNLVFSKHSKFFLLLLFACVRERWQEMEKAQKEPYFEKWPSMFHCRTESLFL